MEFFEPEDSYRTDKNLKFNSKNKITTLSLFLVLSIILLVVVQRDIFGFFEEESFREKCNFENTHLRTDESFYEIKKIKKALDDNKESLSQLKGFIDAEIKENDIMNNSRRYAISVFFEERSEDIKNVPNFICGHKVVIEKK